MGTGEAPECHWHPPGTHPGGSGKRQRPLGAPSPHKQSLTRPAHPPKQFGVWLKMLQLHGQWTSFVRQLSSAHTAPLIASPSRTPGVSMMLRVNPAATREKHCALDVSDCRAATLATLSARMELAVELFPTPAFPAQAKSDLDKEDFMYQVRQSRY